MAQGDRTSFPVGRSVVGIEAIIGAVATSDGVGWISTAGYSQVLIHTEGMTTGTFQIRGSNQTAQPAATDDEAQIGSDFVDAAANVFTSVTTVPRWLKVMVSAWTTGTINSYVLLRP